MDPQLLVSFEEAYLHPEGLGSSRATKFSQGPLSLGGVGVEAGAWARWGQARRIYGGGAWMGGDMIPHLYRKTPPVLNTLS